MTKRIFYLVGVLALLIGIWGFYIRITTGHLEANYGSYIVWGLWVAMYLFFTGIAAGGFLLATLDYLFKIPIFKGLGKIALLGALVSLGAGLLSIWFDLGHMDRIWKIYFQGNSSSVMWQMVWGYTLFGLLIMTSLYLAIQSPNSKWLRILMILGLPLTLFVSGAVGALLGVQAARPFWHVGLFPVQFPVFSLASGVAMLLAAVGLFGKQDDPNRIKQLKLLAVMSIVLQAIKLYFLWADFSQSIYGNVPFNIQAVNEVLFGQYWYAFWILQLGLGSLIPILVLVQPKLATNGFWAGSMGILILLGFAVARANIIFPALSVPELDALTTAFTGPHLTFDYFPSTMEWAVTLGTVGLATLGFLIGSDYIASREASTSQEVNA